MKNFDPVQALSETRHEFGEHGGVNMSIETSTTFTVMKAGTMPEIFEGRLGPDSGGCYLYGRHFNPTVYVLGRQIAALEGAEAGYCTASGMSAISGVLLQLCNSGDKIVSSNTVYGGTFALMHDYLPQKANIQTSFVDMTDLAAVEKAVKAGAKVLYVETMSNPTLRVANIPALSKIARDCGAIFVVDNTFCPVMVSPIQLGADIVVHSLTKFINGASDIVAGAVCGTTEFVSSMMDLHTGSTMLLGPTMDPRSAYLVSSRLPHLGIRMREHCRRAQVFAERSSELGVKVIYPGLSEHPDSALIKEISNEGYGVGGIFCVDLGDSERANRFMENLQLKSGFGFIAVSLGYYDTLLSCSAESTSSEMPEAALEQAGISPGLIRVSIGYTGRLEQRWQQFEQALKEVS